MRNQIVASAVSLLSLTVSTSTADKAGAEAKDGFGGIPFGKSAHNVDWLTPASWMNANSSNARVYYVVDSDRRNLLANVRLYWPGLLCHFANDRLYAVEAEFPANARAFEELRIYLTDRYGRPRTSSSWREAPRDTFVYNQRLQSLSWSSSGGRKSIWLIRHARGGSLAVVDTTVIGGSGDLIGGPIFAQPAR